MSTTLYMNRNHAQMLGLRLVTETVRDVDYGTEGDEYIVTVREQKFVQLDDCLIPDYGDEDTIAVDANRWGGIRRLMVAECGRLHIPFSIDDGTEWSPNYGCCWSSYDDQGFPWFDPTRDVNGELYPQFRC